jgi:hypothetical protein
MAQTAHTIEKDAARPVMVRELIVRATEEALNQALGEHGIQPDHILSIMFEPGSHMAIGDYWPKYRVIYRA